MRASPVLRAANSLLHRRTFAFCINQGLLDPSKHVYMNHNPHNVYVDYWPIGQYPQLHLLQSVAPRTYEPEVQTIFIETFNSRYNLSLKEDDIKGFSLKHLLKNVAKTQDTTNQLLEVVLKRLASNIYVRESKWTWVCEQEVRRRLSVSLVLDQEPETLEEFLEVYNQTIEELVRTSHFGFSEKIEQSATAQEKHFEQEMRSEVAGLKELREGRDENNTFVNRFMRLLHSF